MAYETILYDLDGAVATITPNRPERLNSIVPPMPEDRKPSRDHVIETG